MLVWKVLFLSVIQGVLCSITTQPPSNIEVTENIKDIFIFNMTYTDGPGESCQLVSVTIDSDYVNVTDPEPVSNGYLVRVMLIRELDYEMGSVLTLSYEYQRQCINIENIPAALIRITIRDEMDTAPTFNQTIYRVTVPEDTTVNTTLITGIEATDVDNSDSVTYTVNLQDTTFRYEDRIAGSSFIDVYLNEQLDYETRGTYEFTITAVDSVGLNTTCRVIVDVGNVQDSPPIFSVAQYYTRIGEEAPSGSPVVTVTARDQDGIAEPPDIDSIENQIEYSIIEGDMGMFSINATDGTVMTQGTLEIDNNTISSGLVILTVLAKEVNTSGQAQFGATSSSATVMIQIEDANDNMPVFNAPSYSGVIRENAVLDEFVTIEEGGYISVRDFDQSVTNTHFSIRLEAEDGTPLDLFRPNIASQYSQASLLIMLNKEDGLLGLADTHIKCWIVAEEFGTSSSTTSSRASFVIWIQARNEPPQAPQAVKDSSLSTSDIVVFVLAFLLLANIILTIFICYVMRHPNKDVPFSGIFNRFTKYNVSMSSKKKMPFRLENGNDNHRNDIDQAVDNSESAPQEHFSNGNMLAVPNQVYESFRVNTKNPDESKQSPLMRLNELHKDDQNLQTLPLRDSVSGAARRNRCDVTTIEQKCETSGNFDNQLLSSANFPEVAVEQEQPGGENSVKGILNENRDTSTRCDVSPLKEDPTIPPPKPARLEARLKQNPDDENSLNKDKNGEYRTQQGGSLTSATDDKRCDIVPLDQSPEVLGKGLADILQKVQQKLANGSPFESQEKSGRCDVTPLETRNEQGEPTTGSSRPQSVNSSCSEICVDDGKPLIRKTSKGNAEHCLPEVHPNLGFNRRDSTNEPSSHANDSNDKTTQTKTYLPTTAKNLKPSENQANPTNINNSTTNNNNSKPNKTNVSSPTSTMNSISPSTRPVPTDGHVGAYLPPNQRSQPTVPPVALALPSSFSILPPEEYEVVNNPVYEPSTNFIRTPPLDYVVAAKTLLSTAANVSSNQQSNQGNAPEEGKLPVEKLTRF